MKAHETDIHAYSKKMYNPVTVTSNKSQKHVVHCKDRALADQVQIFPHNKGKHLSEYGTRISQNDHRHLLMVPTGKQSQGGFFMQASDRL